MRAVPLVAVHAIRARRRGRALLALPVAVSWAVLAAGRGGRLGKSAPPPGVEVFDAVVSSAGPGWAATSGRRPSPQWCWPWTRSPIGWPGRPSGWAWHGAAGGV